MDYSKRLAVSYYKTIAVLNESHKIYLVQHQETHKIYVKKILDIYNKQVYQQLFLNPVYGTPDIIEFYEDNNQLTLIEEFVSGETLQDKINNHSLSIELIFSYMNDICTILSGLHSNTPAIIHRDIKPSNIIITKYNQVVLIDFNAAKYLSDSKSDTVLLGTHGYAAPEQYGFGSSTPQTDIYALGILLQEMVKSLPVKCNTFNKIISKCTQLKPQDRYKTVKELQTNINNIKKLQYAYSKYSSTDNHLLDNTLSYNTEYTLHLKKLPKFARFLPPGFRTFTPWHMFIAAPVYILILFMCTNAEIEGITMPGLAIERICLFGIFMSAILIGFNYLNVQKIMPLCKSKNILIHYAGILITDIIVISVLFLLMVVFEIILLQ